MTNTTKATMSRVIRATRTARRQGHAIGRMEAPILFRFDGGRWIDGGKPMDPIAAVLLVDQPQLPAVGRDGIGYHPDRWMEIVADLLGVTREWLYDFRAGIYDEPIASRSGEAYEAGMVLAGELRGTGTQYPMLGEW